MQQQLLVTIDDSELEALNKAAPNYIQYMHPAVLEHILIKVRHGIKLPEEHGDLIDRDEIDYQDDCEGCNVKETGEYEKCKNCSLISTITYREHIESLTPIIPAVYKEENK